MSQVIPKPPVKLIPVKWSGSLGDQDDHVFLPAQLLKKTGLSPGNSVAFTIGNHTRQVTVSLVQCSSAPGPVFFVSPNLQRLCQIPCRTDITLKYDINAKALFAGPLIGLFTVRNILPDSEFGSQEPTLKALVNSGSALLGVVFVFCPEDLDWDRSAVTGRIPVSSPELNDGAWTTLKFPLPDVVYDRIPSRSIELRPEIKETKSRLTAAPHLVYFNPMFLNKWETHVALSGNETVAPYLPPTKLVEDPEDIREFINLYRSVFLKPSLGSLGRRIINIKINGQGFYEFKYRSRDRQTVEGVTPTFESLMKLLRPVMGKRVYVVQKDLRLARYEGCPFDVRVLAQKDAWGRWRRTKIYVRKAAPDSFLSNLSDGGKAKSIVTVLKEVFNADLHAKDGLGEEIRKAVKAIPSGLEQGTGMIWGELGIDLGIDRNGKVWLIEINSKPFRTLVSESGSYKVIERSLMRPLEYAKYLAGFYRHSPEKPEHR